MIGIYKITNLLNDKVYIGQSIDIEKRWEQHKNAIKNSEKSWYLQAREESNSLNDFSFEIIEECECDELDEKEQYWIEYYNSYENGYNMTSNGKGWFYSSFNKTFPPNQRLIKIGDIEVKERIFNKAILTLSGAGLKMLLYFLPKKGIFPLSPKQVKEEIGICEKTYQRGIEDLKKVGFLILESNGTNPIYIFQIKE